MFQFILTILGALCEVHSKKLFTEAILKPSAVVRAAVSLAVACKIAKINVCQIF